MQQCTIPFLIMPGRQEALAICGPGGAHQSVPSFHDQITRFARGCGAELDRSLVRTISDDSSLRTIRAQAPIAVRIDLRGICTFPVLQIKSERFRSIALADAVQADRRWKAHTARSKCERL